MTRRARLLTLGIAAAVAVVVAAVGTAGWFQRRALEELARTASADAVFAAESDGLLDLILRARTAGLESRDAISRTATTTALTVQRARQAHARSVAERRAQARRAARQATGTDKRGTRDAPPAAPRPSGGLLVGDSVALGARSCLQPLGYELDAEVGRQFDAGLEQLRQHATTGLPATVVVELGTNGPFDSTDFAAVMALAGSQRRVVWVTVALPDRSQYAFRDSLNQLITTLAADHANVRVADFAAGVAQHPEWMYDDGIHPNAAGCAGFAAVVDAAVRDP